MQIHTNGIMLCKKSLDILLNAIEQNNHAEIMKAVDGFYEEMRERGIAGEVMRLNINYLLFQLLHLFPDYALFFSKQLQQSLWTSLIHISFDLL